MFKGSRKNIDQLLSITRSFDPLNERILIFIANSIKESSYGDIPKSYLLKLFKLAMEAEEKNVVSYPSEAWDCLREGYQNKHRIANKTAILKAI